jgi:hypothetical protein
MMNVVILDIYVLHASEIAMIRSISSGGLIIFINESRQFIYDSELL